MISEGTFCWHDLATDDVDQAAAFYSGVFGWQSRLAQANGGVFHRLSLDGRDVGSAYRIDGRAREGGVRAHWTPYVAVASVDASVIRVLTYGGMVLVPPFDVTEAGSGLVTRISVIADPSGAPLGLWEYNRADG